MRNKISGQVTVFSAIVMMAVLVLAGLLVDISRINAARAIVRRSVGLAARSLLAEYGSKLKENYGMFAIVDADEASLCDKFEEYLSCGLSIPCDEERRHGGADLFGFRIEKIKVTPIYNLSENNVTKKQILEYMKYRAPTELIENFMEKLLTVKDVGKMSGAYKQKVTIDKILGSMDKSQQKLKKLVDGAGSEMDKFINGFNLNGAWESAYHHFNSLSKNLESIMDSINSLDGIISGLEAEISNPENEEDTLSGEAQNRLDQLMQERSDLYDAARDTGERMEEVWNEIRHSLTGDYIKANMDAAKEIEKIIEKGKKAQEAIARLEKYMEDNFSDNAGEFTKDFKEQTQLELDKLKSLILEGERAEEILEKVNGNSSLLKNIAVIMDEARTGQSNGPASELPSVLLDMVKNYSNISYNYSKPEKGEKEDDPRDGKKNAVKEFIYEKIPEDINYETAGIDKNSLPSFTKVETGSFEQEDEAFIGGYGDRSDDGGNSPDGEVVYGGRLDGIDDEMNFYDEEGMFQENALEFIAGIGNLAERTGAALRDNIYINEYIMGTFKNSVPVLVHGNETVKDKNLHGIEKESLETYYDSEVEYILHGQPSQALNNIMTKAEILLVRFGLNTLHVYTDAKKKALANSIATAVAGWWTGGAGIPVISNLVMCGWGMGEALIDVSDLACGKSVPIYKLKGDWKLDIGMAPVTGPNMDKRLYFNYHDYLRLFLLTVSENKKLSRIEDLIQLNMGKSKTGFKMSECYTYLRVEAEVSMKYLFITAPFVRRELKTGDGRYLFKVLAYEGY
ncbi:MAG: DUF5702 domain-containing protein [Bacillota bacterium]